MANETVKKSRIYQDLDLSFTATDSNDVGKKLDVNAAKQALRILINTNFYSRKDDLLKTGVLSILTVDYPLQSRTRK